MSKSGGEWLRPSSIQIPDEHSPEFSQVSYDRVYQFSPIEIKLLQWFRDTYLPEDVPTPWLNGGETIIANPEIASLIIIRALLTGHGNLIVSLEGDQLVVQGYDVLINGHSLVAMSGLEQLMNDPYARQILEEYYYQQSVTAGLDTNHDAGLLVRGLMQDTFSKLLIMAAKTDATVFYHPQHGFVLLNGNLDQLSDSHSYDDSSGIFFSDSELQTAVTSLIEGAVPGVVTHLKSNSAGEMAEVYTENVTLEFGSYLSEAVVAALRSGFATQNGWTSYSSDELRDVMVNNPGLLGKMMSEHLLWYANQHGNAFMLPTQSYTQESFPIDQQFQSWFEGFSIDYSEGFIDEGFKAAPLPQFEPGFTPVTLPPIREVFPAAGEIRPEPMIFLAAIILLLLASMKFRLQ